MLSTTYIPLLIREWDIVHVDVLHYRHTTAMDGGSTGNAGAISSKSGNPDYLMTALLADIYAPILPSLREGDTG